MICILLIAARPIVRLYCAALLAGPEDIEVVGEAEDPAAAAKQVGGLAPDVVLLHQDPLGLESVPAVAEFLAEAPGCAVVTFTLRNAQRAEAHIHDRDGGITITRGTPERVLIESIRAAAARSANAASEWGRRATLAR